MHLEGPAVARGNLCQVKIGTHCFNGGVWKHIPPYDLAHGEAKKYCKEGNPMLNPQEQKVPQESESELFCSDGSYMCVFSSF